MKVIGLPLDQIPPRTDVNCDWIVYINNREYYLFEDEYEQLQFAIENQRPHFWPVDKSFGIRPSMVTDEVPIPHQNLLPESPIDFYSPDAEYTEEERERHRKNFEEIKSRARALKKAKEQEKMLVEISPEEIAEVKEELHDLAAEQQVDPDFPF